MYMLLATLVCAKSHAAALSDPLCWLHMRASSQSWLLIKSHGCQFPWLLPLLAICCRGCGAVLARWANRGHPTSLDLLLQHWYCGSSFLVWPRKYQTYAHELHLPNTLLYSAGGSGSLAAAGASSSGTQASGGSTFSSGGGMQSAWVSGDGVMHTSSSTGTVPHLQLCSGIHLCEYGQARHMHAVKHGNEAYICSF